MLDSILTLSVFRAAGSVGVLGLVLFLDNRFRREVYGRSDPLSFSLLGYSFLLVVSDSFLRILQSIKAGPPVHVEIQPSFLIAALVYAVLLFAIFFSAKAAHKNLQIAQERAVERYIEGLQETTHGVEDAVWGVLKKLGSETIEPDVFQNRQVKADRRKEYLQLVKKLTKADIKPADDESKLLVNEASVRRWARIGYIVTAIFGVVSTLYFFLVR